MEFTTYHPIALKLPGKLRTPATSSERPMFGMPGWSTAPIPEDVDVDPVKKPKSPSRPNQPNNAGTMPTAGRQLAAMRDMPLRGKK